ncbi:MAG TPA: hypothetical protein VK809_02460, partial [Bacteroidia bacterium]|nr:hypothetical protein [Bacteroidia bacterium]
TANYGVVVPPTGGFAGFGTITPVSRLDDAGSFGTGTIDLAPGVGTTTTLTNDYSTIIATPTAVATVYTLALPSAVTDVRRIYTIVYNGSAKGTINITSPTAGAIMENGTAITPLPLTTGSVRLQSDGSNWNVTTLSAGGTLTAANNGLTLNGTTVQLGGANPLIQNTTLTLNGFNLTETGANATVSHNIQNSNAAGTALEVTNTGAPGAGAGIGILGETSQSGGYGVQGSNYRNGGTGIYGSAQGANSVAINGSTSGTGSMGLYGSATGTGSYGVYGTGTLDGVYGTGATGVYGFGSNIGVAGLGSTTGVSGTATTNGVLGTGLNAVVGNSTGGTNSMGGGFTNNSNWTHAAYYDGTSYYGIYSNQLLVSTAGKSTVVEDTKGDTRLMYCSEAPELLFQDFGTASLVNGKIHIDLDPIYAKNVAINEQHPLRVILTMNDECPNSLYVTNRTATGFDVVEMNHGTSNASFTYEVIANRADDKKGNNGTARNFSSWRFQPIKVPTPPTKK